MIKNKRPVKPFKGATWNESKRRWEGKIPQKLNFRYSSPPPKRSETQKKEDAIYERLKPVWRASPKNHFCQALCKDKGLYTPAARYPHHIRGRGKLLNDVRFWLAICPHCHQWIETNRQVARQRGWLASRDLKTMRLEGLL